MQSVRAFTLIELSIVLVIIGLLGGGILAGQSLIRAAEMRSITTDAQRFATALNSFRDRYFALPGDMNNATRFWNFSGTAAAPGCVTNSAAPVNAPGACDGNGDGRIAYGSGANNVGEAFQAWRHLANAGLVEGTYTGTAGPAGASDYLTTNAPRARAGNALWMLSYIKNDVPPSISSHLLTVNYLNWVGVGAGAGTGSWADDGFMKNEEAWSVDTKLDDGKPGRGKVHAMGMDTECTTNASGTNFDAEYANTRSRTTACALLFNFGR